MNCIRTRLSLWAIKHLASPAAGTNKARPRKTPRKTQRLRSYRGHFPKIQASLGNACAPGFTIIELLIVIAIIGILVAIAYPTYTSHVRKARRADAKSLILRAANEEEKVYAVQNHYAGDMVALGLPETTDNGAYAVSITTSGDDEQKYEITATAQDGQTDDICRTLTIDQTGAKKAWTGASTGQGDNVSSKCW